MRAILARRASVAVHEAGHAVIGARNGVSVSLVNVSPGVCQWAGGSGVARAKGSLAGALAAMRLSTLLDGALSSNAAPSEADADIVLAGARGFSVAEREALLSVTRREVIAQWPWIMQTAMALFQRGMLEGRELASILDGPGDTSSPTWFERHCRGLLSSITQGESVCEVLHTAATDILGPSPRPDGTGDRTP
jgi:hypothetical protein